MRLVVESYRGKSVRVFRLDRETCLQRLRERAQELLRCVPEVVEVRLFGSLARGDELPGSDADLLVILAETAEPFLERTGRLQRYLAGAGLGCDLFAYTEAEVAQLRREGNRLIAAADAEGIVLARR